MPRMGDLAATDVYNAFDVPLDQGTNVGWANRMGEILTTRPQYDETVQYTTASPLVQITEGDIGRATEAAMGVSGGGMAVKPERIAGAALRHGDQIFKGINHGEAYENAIKQLGFDPFTNANIAERRGLNGFVTDTGRFVSRQEAARIVGSDKPAIMAHDLPPLGIRAYHSSPHDFDKFDLAKIGSGEGAQVYGHGLYFAESPAVSGQGGQYWNQFLRHTSLPKHELEAAQILRNNNFDRAAAAQEVEGLVKHYDDKYSRDMLKVLQSDKPVGPRTYEVEIKADPAYMLDWDKALSAQPHIEDVLRKSGFNDAKWPYSGMQGAQSGTSLQPLTSGEDVYRALGIERMGRNTPTNVLRRAATDALGEAGIPGIKYLDQGSRGAAKQADELLKIYETPERVREVAQQAVARGEDADYWQSILRGLGDRSHNYVIFDPGIIDIMKKYGIAGAAATPVMGALAAQDRYER